MSFHPKDRDDHDVLSLNDLAMTPQPQHHQHQHSSPKRFITLELIRKRSEHNASLVSTLEELALHQEELQSIGPILGRTCGKTLKILLLQNNVIERMVARELKLFKSLEYLNLALNNIHCIEQGCLSRMEWLRKLDLTLNFIDVDCLETSIDELQICRSLNELFLIGNPCMGWSDCRAYVVARLPNLQYLDGTETKRSERITALQQLPVLTTQLRELAQQRGEERQRLKQDEDDGSRGSDDESSYISDEAKTQHNPKTRTKISNELYDQKMTKEKQASENTVKHKGEKEWEEEHKVAVENAREREEESSRKAIKQCNQGKYNFYFEEERSKSGVETLILRVDIPKHLSTSLIDVDMHPTYVSIVIKKKILRVILPVEVILVGAIARRSAASGDLELVMPKMNPKEIVVGLADMRATTKNAGEKAKANTTSSSRSSTASSKSDAAAARKRENLGKKMMKEYKDLVSSSKSKACTDEIESRDNGREQDDEAPPLY